MVFNQSPGSEGKYYDLWKDTVPKILDVLTNKTGSNEIQLLRRDFLIAGNRKSYAFSLNIVDGQVTNNVSGSAVARDLAGVLTRNGKIREHIGHGSFHFRMDEKFKLTIT